MKLELKAYKCIFPRLFTEAYNQYMWQDPKQFDIIYGKSQKEAVLNKCKFDESYSFWELKQSIQTRRDKDNDLYSQDRSSILNELTDKYIDILTHSLGVIVGGICPKEFYRNRYVCDLKNEYCEHLVNIGLMGVWQKLGSECYYVSEDGKEAIKTLLLIKNTHIDLWVFVKEST